MRVVLAAEWAFYDAARHAGLGGVYLLVLRRFEHAPFRAGMAAVFSERLAALEAGLGRGTEMFLRRPFLSEVEAETHLEFALQWEGYQAEPEAERRRLVWVPRAGTAPEMGAEGLALWAAEVRTLVSVRGEDRAAVAGQVQRDLMAYYEGLLERAVDWRVEGGAPLVGEVVEEGVPGLRHVLEGGEVGDAAEFFVELSCVRG